MGGNIRFRVTWRFVKICHLNPGNIVILNIDCVYFATLLTSGVPRFWIWGGIVSENLNSQNLSVKMENSIEFFLALGATNIDLFIINSHTSVIRQCQLKFKFRCIRFFYRKCWFVNAVSAFILQRRERGLERKL